MRVVVFGAGDVGTHLAAALSAAGEEVVLVDRDPVALAEADEGADVLAVHGDCTHRKILEAARIDRADLVVAVTGSDHTNLAAAALAADRGAPSTIARVDDPGFYHRAAGVERGVLGTTALLCASRLVSEELLRQVTSIDASFAASFCDGRLEVVAAPVTAKGRLKGVVPHALKVRRGVSLVAVRRDSVLRSIHDVSHLETDDELLLSGPPDQVFAAFRQLDDQGPRRAVIVGGGDVGTQLATALSSIERRVQVVEMRRERCEFLARQLPGVNVIHADGTSINHLRDERVGAADYVLSVTRRDEVNLMVSLLVRDLGVHSALALVHRPGYSETYSHLGLTATAGTHQVIERAVSALIPRVGAIAEQPLPDAGYSLFEYVVPPLDRAWTPGQLLLSSDALLLGLVRGDECMTPSSAERLQPGDRIVISAAKAAQEALSHSVRAMQGHAR